MRRSQKGYLYSEHGAWFLRWYDAQGNRQTKRLASTADYPRKSEARALANDAMVEANAAVRNGALNPGIVVSDFINNIYLPYTKEYKRPSTYDGYCGIARLVNSFPSAAKRVRDIQTFDAQNWLREITFSRDLSSTTVKHIKAFLSGVFRRASILGLRKDNPFRETEIPSGLRQPCDTPEYSLAQTEALLRCITDLETRTQIAVAAFAGLRRGEIAGLNWEDYRGGELRPAESWWHGIVGPTKSKASKAPVPVVPRLAVILDEWKLFCGSPARGPMFVHRDLAEIARRKIRPRIEGKAIWLGWHSWRRGLGSRLHEAGVPETTIQQLLRHESVVTTREHYIKHTSAESREAMKRLDSIETATANSKTTSTHLQ